MSWKCEVHADGEWVSNGIRFETEKEATDYGYDLLSRWFVPDNHRAVEVSEPVTHVWNGRSIEEWVDKAVGYSKDTI